MAGQPQVGPVNWGLEYKLQEKAGVSTPLFTDVSMVLKSCRALKCLSKYSVE